MLNDPAAVVADPGGAAQAAAAVLARLAGAPRHDVAVILGSGWADAAAELGPPERELKVTELPGFPAPTVAGHAGRLLSIRVGGRRVLVMMGRSHLYEGHHPAVVVHGVRTAVAAGCGVIVLTNAAGGVRPEYAVGQPVLISDHINLTGTTCLQGPDFVDLTDLYSNRLRGLCREVEPALAEGVYAGFRGPQFETPAEIVMIRRLGGDLVGMSTVLEAIAARAAGAEVLGISLVTNPAAGVTPGPIDHQGVLAAARAGAAPVGRLLATVIAQLPPP